MAEFGKMLIVFGALLLLAGVVLVLGGRAHWPIGRLPGDIVYRGKHSTIYFPLVTCILLSIVLTVILWVIGNFGR